MSKRGKMTVETLPVTQGQIEELLVQLYEARGKLAMCRQFMEANDPINAEIVFGRAQPPRFDRGEDVYA